MKPTTLLSIIFVVTTSLLLASCSKSFESKTYEAIHSAKSRFPNLVIFDGSEYQLVRSLKIPKPQVTMQLFRPAKSPDGSQEILVISNSSYQYAIPVPSIRFKSYWNFVYDTWPRQTHLASANFETELDKALDFLNINDDYYGMMVLNELFVSVLQARNVNAADTTDLKLKNQLGRSYADSCIDLSEQNYKAVTKSLNSIHYHYANNVFLYKQMIFKISYLDSKQNKKKRYKIDVYKNPCVIDVTPFIL